MVRPDILKYQRFGLPFHDVDHFVPIPLEEVMNDGYLRKAGLQAFLVLLRIGVEHKEVLLHICLLRFLLSQFEIFPNYTMANNAR